MANKPNPSGSSKQQENVSRQQASSVPPQASTSDWTPSDFMEGATQEALEIDPASWPMNPLSDPADAYSAQQMYDWSYSYPMTSGADEGSMAWNTIYNPTSWPQAAEGSPSGHQDQSFDPPGQESETPPRFANFNLNEKEKFLLFFKDECGNSWKEISEAFFRVYGETHQIPALQMRYRRLKQRIHALESARTWNDRDTQAFLRARDYWVNKRDQIISEKMLDFGATQAWTPETVAIKFKELANVAPVRERKSSRNSPSRS